MRKPSKTNGRYALKDVRAFGGVRSSLRFARDHNPMEQLLLRFRRIIKRLHNAALEAKESFTDLRRETQTRSIIIDYTDHSSYEA